MENNEQWRSSKIPPSPNESLYGSILIIHITALSDFEKKNDGGSE